MTTIAWDQAGDRTFQTGVDRGVLYPPIGVGIPWNGLTSVEDSTPSELTSYHMDGIKILDHVSPGDFTGVLKAFTYPDEFDLFTGIVDEHPGFSFHDQRSKPFNLTYRTRIGNDLEGSDYGYKIHLLYNLKAKPSNVLFTSIKDTISPVEFSWDLSGVPPIIASHRPTVHISIDTTRTSPDIVANIEGILYGTPGTESRFPSILELRSIFTFTDALIIIDNGDGTWQAIDRSNHYITMLDSTTFKIDDALATYLNFQEYTISDTYAPFPSEPLFDKIQMASEDGSPWDISVVIHDGTGTVDVSASDPAHIDLVSPLRMLASDSGVWKFVPTNDGTLDFSASTPDGAPWETIRFKAPDNSVWVLTVDTDGVPDLAPE